jgi:hypothetical protein
MNDPFNFTESIEVPVLSEQMVRRDNFFHSCWMEMKRRCPMSWEEMNVIEMYIAGLEPDKEKKDTGNDEEPKEKGTIL